MPASLAIALFMWPAARTTTSPSTLSPSTTACALPPSILREPRELVNPSRLRR
ncbi:MAG: hypothetical protein RXR47_01560 [Nitrososphaeria archaeon]